MDLIENRKKVIQDLASLMIANEDGETFVGNGKDIVREAPGVKISHEFADSIYLRRMDLKKDNLVVGAIHKHLHIWFLLQGHVSIAKKEGVEDYVAPCYVVSQPGDQRVIVANEDSIFVNIHKNPTNTKDIEEIERNIVALNYKDFEEYIKNNNK
jgi:hypothetical protein